MKLSSIVFLICIPAGACANDEAPAKWMGETLATEHEPYQPAWLGFQHLPATMQYKDTLRSRILKPELLERWSETETYHPAWLDSDIALSPMQKSIYPFFWKIDEDVAGLESRRQSRD